MAETNPFKIPEFCNAAEWLALARTPGAASALVDLAAFGREQAALAQALSSGSAGGQAAAFEGLVNSFAERCQRLFAAPSSMNLTARYQAAAQAHAALFGEIATDAARRFAAELATTGPPITTLAALQALWIDCGERAFSAAAHGEAFAASQAELLAAWVELKAGT